MVDEETSGSVSDEESTAGNPEETESGSEEQDPEEGKSKFVGDQRFKTPDDLYKSYRELESKLGDVEDLQEKASLAYEFVEALSAEKNITKAEARALLREQSRKTLDKHAPVLQERRGSDEVKELRLLVDKRDLLDEVPEAREVIDQIVALAKATGKTVREVYNRDFKTIVDRLSASNMENPEKKAATYKPSYRDGSSPTEEPPKNRDYEKAVKSFSSEHDPVRRRAAIQDALHAKLFKK